MPGLMMQLLILPGIGPESGPQGFIDAAFQGNVSHLVSLSNKAITCLYGKQR